MTRKLRYEIIPDSISGEAATEHLQLRVDEFETWSRTYWSTVVEALRRCERSGRLSKDIAGVLAGAVARALSGSPPSVWVSRPAGSTCDTSEMPCEWAALNYAAAATVGLISDRRYVQTICEAYGVSRRQYYRWKGQFEGHPHARFEVGEMLSRSLEYWRQIERMMRLEAARYRRSHSSRMLRASPMT